MPHAAVSHASRALPRPEVGFLGEQQQSFENLQVFLAKSEDEQFGPDDFSVKLKLSPSSTIALCIFALDSKTHAFLVVTRAWKWNLKLAGAQQAPSSPGVCREPPTHRCGNDKSLCLSFCFCVCAYLW